MHVDGCTQVKDKVLTILNFTSMLIEHSYSRYIYNSTEVSPPPPLTTKACQNYHITKKMCIYLFN